MWTEQTLARHAARSAPRKRYPSGLTNAEWEFIAPLLPKPALRGRHRVTDLRKIVNAVRYLVRSGCELRMLPTHFPLWQAVYWWSRRLVRNR
jgi:putative transposase